MANRYGFTVEGEPKTRTRNRIAMSEFAQKNNLEIVSLGKYQKGFFVNVDGRSVSVSLHVAKKNGMSYSFLVSRMAEIVILKPEDSDYAWYFTLQDGIYGGKSSSIYLREDDYKDHRFDRAKNGLAYLVNRYGASYWKTWEVK